MNNTEKRFLAHKIWQLAEIFANIGDKFDSFDEKEIDDLISEDYPFDKSFDEMISKVLEWRDTVSDKVNWEKNEELKESAKFPKRVKYKGQIYEAVEDAKLNESNGMRRYTRGELRDMIRTGMAKELTSFEDRPKDYDKVGYSSGTYGINGGLIQDRETGEFYVIPDRSSLLLKIF